MKHLSSESFTFIASCGAAALESVARDGTQVDPAWDYYSAKRFFDISVGILLLPVLILTSLILLVVNPSRNKGPLFYLRSNAYGQKLRLVSGN